MVYEMTLSVNKLIALGGRIIRG